MADKSKKGKERTSRSIEEEEKSEQNGLVYIGHLPHGFYEDELKGYFSQFGTVTGVKVARNRKTGHCKGFAFVEFQCEEVAEIVAQTMNNYLMFNKLLKCQVVDRSKIRGKLGKGHILKKRISFAHRHRKAQQLHNRCRTISQHRQRIKKLLKKEKKKRKELSSLGIDYTFPGYKASVQTSVYVKGASHIVFEEES